MTLIAVAPNKFAKGFDGSGRSVPLAYTVVELKAALEHAFQSDAHLVTYVVQGGRKQPRINKTGLAHFDGKVEVGVFLCDVDNPGHANWDDALLKAAMDQYETLDVLKTAGVYHTAHGRRIVQPIEKPIPALEVEPYLKRWLLELEKAGIAVDWTCVDWTRHFRLPNVKRGGQSFRSPFLRLERMRPIALEPLPPTPATPEPAPTSAATAAPLSLPEVNWSADVPDRWREGVKTIAAAVRSVATEWHTLFMALAGALLSRNVPAEQVPALCRAISIATGADTRTDDREAAARTTVQRRLAGQPATGLTRLAKDWPEVAAAVEAATATGNEARLRAELAAPPLAEACSLEETTRALEDAIRRAPDGLTLIKAECGLGKTAAALRVAAERAAKPYASKDAKGEHAPPQSKTSISLDKHALAIQVAQDLAQSGTAVKRFFGPLSLRHPDKTPVCRYHASAEPLVAGGQRMQWEFCRGRDQDPCEHYDTCPAKDGVEGPKDARVAVGPHALMAQLSAAAGTTGILVIDEPPELLETVEITVAEIDTAARSLESFADRFAAAMRPALAAIRTFVAEVAELGKVATIPDAIRACAHAIDPVELDQACVAANVSGRDPVACVAEAHDPVRKGHPPPLFFAAVRACRESPKDAAALGTASKVMGAIYRAVIADAPVVARVEEGDRGGRALHVTFANEQLVDSLRREGPVVAMDANADLLLPVIAKVVGYTPPIHTFCARDGAPIEREVLRTGSANRKSWFKGGVLTIEGSLKRLVQSALDWAREDPSARKLGLITMLTVELALRAALGEDVERQWRKTGQPSKLLEDAKRLLGPIVRSWPGEIVLAHYGAVRGLNHMADMDCLITLGDPWPNLGEVQNQVAYLGLASERWEERAEAMCRAELEQAHGRLRTVHRTRPGRALHVGNVAPGGWGWSSGNVGVKSLRGGRPKNESAAQAGEIAEMVRAIGGLQKAVELLGCSRAALVRYQSGLRAAPAGVIESLRRLSGW
jgi:hypothetical protein